ncbi:MAG TPA: NAD(P)H-dependent oxidoreductase subunit E, partial [Firmicutes bacterium]|nr:NAD(P)H-dependent oxidoreductase subunit E [Bacillota bacterium]
MTVTSCNIQKPNLGEVIEKYKEFPGSLLDLLHEVQEIDGYLSRDV